MIIFDPLPEAPEKSGASFSLQSHAQPVFLCTHMAKEISEQNDDALDLDLERDMDLQKLADPELYRLNHTSERIHTEFCCGLGTCYTRPQPQNIT